MKKPPRHPKPHKGSRKGRTRKAANQARRASILVYDRAAAARPVKHESRAQTAALPFLGFELTRPVFPALLRSAVATARRPHRALRRALPAQFAARVRARALPAFEDREALALMSLPLVAIALMMALGLVEIGRHRYPVYRGLELASAARPAALPRRPAPVIPEVAGSLPASLAPVPGIAAIAAVAPPSARTPSLLQPDALGVVAPPGPLAARAPGFASAAGPVVLANSRAMTSIVPQIISTTALIPPSAATAPFAPPAEVAGLHDVNEASLTRLAAADPVLPEPSFPAPRMSGQAPLAPALGAVTRAPGGIAASNEAPPSAVTTPAGESVASAGHQLALLAPQLAPAETTPLIAPPATLFTRYAPGSGPEYCEAAPPAPRPVRLQAAPAAFGHALADAARGQTGDLVIYNDTYRHMSYPWGDVSPLYGVCTDVVIRAYRTLGVDLQRLVHESALGSGDTSIEHRRVETLRRFFTVHGQSLPVTALAEDYQPGDVVTYYRPQNRHSKTHIALVSNEVGPSGRYKIIHNRGWGPQSEDALFVDEITGHYRYWTPPDTPPPVTAAETKPEAKGVLPSPRLLRQAVTRLRTDGIPARGLGH